MEPITKIEINNEDVTKEVISWQCTHKIFDGASSFNVKLDNIGGKNRNRFTTGSFVKIYGGFAEIHSEPKLIFTGYVDNPNAELSSSGPSITFPGRNAGYKMVDSHKIWKSFEEKTVAQIAIELLEEAGYSEGDISEFVLDNPMYYQYKGTQAVVSTSAGRGSSKSREPIVDTEDFEGSEEEFEKSYSNVKKNDKGLGDIVRQYIVRDKTVYSAIMELIEPYGLVCYLDEKEKIHITTNATTQRHVQYILKATKEEYPLLLECSFQPNLRGIKNVVEIYGGDNDSSDSRIGIAKDLTNIELVSKLTGLPKEKCEYTEKIFSNNPSGTGQDSDKALEEKAFSYLAKNSRFALSGDFRSEALIYARGGHIIEINEPTTGNEGKFLIEEISFDFNKSSGFTSRGKVSSRLGDVTDRDYKDGYLFTKG